MGTDQRVLRIDVTDAERGRRIDLVLLEHLEGWSRSQVSTWIRGGRVRFRGELVKKAGQVVSEPGEALVDLSAPVVEAPAAAAGLAVIHADDDLLVADKPAGLLTQANAPAGEPGAAEILARSHGPLAIAEPPRANGVVHRLDRDTSGVLLLAKSERALESLLTQFRERTVKKEYLALVHGDPRFDSDWIEAPLGRSSQHPDRVSVLPRTGRAAATFYEVRERFGVAALVAAFPKTGRTHQVRVHLAHIGHSLLGDSVYRPARRQLAPLPAGIPPAERHMLHARALEIAHPATGIATRFESELAPDFAALLAALRASSGGQAPAST